MSRKKRDVMLSAAASGTNPPPNTGLTQNRIRLGAATISTSFLSGVHTFLFLPTQRYLVPNNASFVAARTASTCYLKGIAERYTLLPNDPSVWWHRRVVFATKVLYAEAVSSLAGNGVIAPQPDASTTTTRKFRDMSSDNGAGYSTVATALATDIFEGVYTTDWVDPMRAKLDRTRITVLSDRLVQIKSNNDSPAPRIVKHWTPINKSIVYQDEENGTTMSVSPFSVNSKRGIGNVYVADFFECPVPNSTTTTTLTLDSEQTMYWHER